MITLQQCNWKAFRINDIFEVNTGANVSKKNMSNGVLPRITATDTNNGVDSFTGYSSNKNFRVFENCVSISFLGSCFYQPYKASYDMKIHNIIIKGRELNKYIALFIANQCKRTCSQVTYGNQMSSSDLQKQLIYLPSTPEGLPDYDYMEQYMREKERKLLNQYRSYILLKINELGGGNTLKINHWRAFELTEIFTITATKSGIDRNKLTGQKGDFPYITRSDNENGWDSFIGMQPKYKTDKGNVISIGLDTQTAFYQPIPFYTGQNIQVFSNKHLNKYIAIFMLPLLKIQLNKFNWGGNGATLGRLKRLHIMLPATESNQPDYMYMEQHMRQKELKILKNYIKIRQNV